MRKTKKKDSVEVEVEGTYETEIEFVCPVRGKVKQKVKVKRLKPAGPPKEVKEEILPKSLALKLDSEFPGLVISDDSLEEQEEEERRRKEEEGFYDN